MSKIKINIFPGKQLFWEEFNLAYKNSVALDGFVVGGPQWDENTLNANFDHHSGVVREATMSTAMQVYFAIKGGFMSRMKEVNVFINDVDQDTCMAIWLLQNYRLFEGNSSLPQINRILSLNDRMDITGGSFPINLSDKVYHQHCWVFQPYTDLRKSGAIARQDTDVFSNCLEAVLGRLTKLLLGEAGEYEPIVEANVLYKNHLIVVLDETKGGIESRHMNFGNGVIDKAYLSIIAKRDDGNLVYTLGRRSRYIDFPLLEQYKKINLAEGTSDSHNCWGGSDIVGGSPRMTGSKLTWQEIVGRIA